MERIRKRSDLPKKKWRSPGIQQKYYLTNAVAILVPRAHDPFGRSAALSKRIVGSGDENAQWPSDFYSVRALDVWRKTRA